jgi:hypothetical protein
MKIYRKCTGIVLALLFTTRLFAACVDVVSESCDPDDGNGLPIGQTLCYTSCWTPFSACCTAYSSDTVFDEYPNGYVHTQPHVSYCNYSCTATCILGSDHVVKKTNTINDTCFLEVCGGG